MLRSMFKLFVAVCACALLAQGAYAAPVYDVEASPFPPHALTSLENLEKAIMRAGIQLGWQIVPKGPGKIEGILNLRSHQAIVDITYDTKMFSIKYKSSVNLDYSNGDIHRNYNGWVQNLEKAIRIQAGLL
jgi:hypothetical protein